MKKLRLSIPEPCHEDWEKMSQEEKGKYCASCKKTVIDFSQMSDRQLAEFFKKPVTGVCGHFYHDQLDRTLDMPGKRLPWLRYFFRFTWPAFVLMLKSCGDKTIMGKARTEINSPVPPKAERTRLVGDTVLMDQQIDSTMNGVVSFKGFIQPVIKEEKGTGIIKPKSVRNIETMRDIEIENLRPSDTSILPKTVIDSSEEPLALSGAVVVGIYIKKIKNDPIVPFATNREETQYPEVNLYPNPVTSGSFVTIAFSKTKDISHLVQLFSESGQLVQSTEIESSETNTFRIQIPSTLKSGIYFLRMSHKNGIITKKLVVM
ncbi:MAG: T9SS type A sorting domain-containing protein [Flavisolibacter sp.]